MEKSKADNQTGVSIHSFTHSFADERSNRQKMHCFKLERRRRKLLQSRETEKESTVGRQGEGERKEWGVAMKGKAWECEGNLKGRIRKQEKNPVVSRE